MKSSIRLGKILGIPIGLNPSWFVTLGILLVILGFQLFPAMFPELSRWAQWSLAGSAALLFFASILAHELAHSLVARSYGIPVKGITLFIFGGVAQLGREAPRPKAEFLMAAAGPATSILLAALFFGLWRVSGAADDPVPTLWMWLGIANLGVGIFNLAPGFPMDGGRLVRSLLWAVTGSFSVASRWATLGGQAVAYGLIAVGLLSLLSLLSPHLSPWNGLWLVVIGFFLDGAARQSYLQVRILDSLRSYRARDFMSQELPLIARDVALAQALAAYPAWSPRAYLFVVDNGQVVGIVNRDQARNLSPRQREQLTMGDVMVQASQVPTVHPDEDAASILQRMEAEDVAQMPVVDGGYLVGVVSREGLLRLLREHRRTVA